MHELIQPLLDKAQISGVFNIEPLAGDASTRRYYRVVVDTQSYVLMQWDPFVDDLNYPFLSVLNLLQKCQVHVPKVFAKLPEHGLILLEDLGDYTLERRFYETNDFSFTEPFYKKTLDEVIKIHFDATHSPVKSTAQNLAFDKDKLLWEMNYARKHLLEGLAALPMNDKVHKSLDTIFESICTKLADEPMRIVHRDFHSRNVMIKLNNTFLIDFQDARLGAVQYDLVSLLRDSYVDISAEQESRLLAYYQEQVLLRHQHSFDDTFLDIYELQSIQRTFKACGSFASFAQLRSDKRYLKYIRKTLRHVIKSLNHFPEYSDFSNMIIDAGLLERSFE